MADVQQLCTFTVGDMYLGIDVRLVQEVFRHQAMTTVPLAPPAVAGLMNLRGEIVTAVDLGSRLGLADRESAEPPMNVVVRAPDNGVFSLLVDDIGKVVDVASLELDALPATLSGPRRDLLLGCYRLPGRLLLLLNIERARLSPLEPTAWVA